MSKLAQPNGDDYPEAAERHLADADTLLQAGRFCGAGYLTGYAVECVFKTYILIEGTSPAHIHKLNDLSQSALRLVAMQNAKTAKYPLRTTAGHSIYHTQTGWREAIRYCGPARVTDQQAREWLAEAQAVCTPALQQMKLDGLI